VVELKGSFSPPVTRLGGWLVEPGPNVPPDIRPLLLAGLFGTLVIFAGGVVNTVAISLTSAFHHPTPVFIGWATFELIIAAARLVVLLRARRASAAGRPTPTDLYLFLALAWAGGVGLGAILGMTSGDWVITTLTCVSAGAMAGGIAFRNFYAPRLSAAMIAVSFGPCMLGAALSGQWILWLLTGQIPIYLASMWIAAYRLNGLFVRTLAAERENDRRASHDMLTGLSNRAGLERVIDVLRDFPAPRATLLYLDLDGFKAINDRHGHAAGDTLLRMVATRLAGLVPADGLAARIGGDEFVLLLPEADRGDTLGHAGRVIATIADMAYDLGEGRSATLGASIGVARLPDHGMDVVTLLAAADAALYEAKALGRCRAVLAKQAKPARSRRPIAA
jgi:diguanylate cyclase (GGDEF)-like protein